MFLACSIALIEAKTAQQVTIGTIPMVEIPAATAIIFCSAIPH
jgi:hypothetical protein